MASFSSGVGTKLAARPPPPALAGSVVRQRPLPETWGHSRDSWGPSGAGTHLRAVKEPFVFWLNCRCAARLALLRKGETKTSRALRLRGNLGPQGMRVAGDNSERASYTTSRTSNPGILKLGSANTPRSTCPIQEVRDPPYENFNFHLNENLKN